MQVLIRVVLCDAVAARVGGRWRSTRWDLGIKLFLFPFFNSSSIFAFASRFPLSIRSLFHFCASLSVSICCSLLVPWTLVSITSVTPLVLKTHVLSFARLFPHWFGHSSGISHSFSNKRDKVLPNLTKLVVNSRRFDGRELESPAPIANQGVMTQLSDQISTLNERMDEFTSRIEELNSKFATRKVSASQQNLPLQTEAGSGSGSTSFFVTSLGHGSLLPNSSSSSQLAKESTLMEEVLLIARGQRQITHQLNTLSNLLHERSRLERTDQAGRMRELESVAIPLVLTLAIGAVGVFLFKGLPSQK